MKAIKIVLAAAFILTLASNAAFAKTFRVKAAAGKQEFIGAFGVTFDGNCKFMKPGTYKVKTAPKNGKVRVEKVAVRLKEGECKGATYHGYAIYYRGNGKKDDVKISFTGSAYVDYNLNRTWTQKYKINH